MTLTCSVPCPLLLLLLVCFFLVPEDVVAQVSNGRATATDSASPELPPPPDLNVEPLPSAATEVDEFVLPAEPALADLLRIAILESVPETYIDDRHWGRQEERFSGLRVRGTKVSVREKLVNHGFWHRYSATLLKPEETLKVEICPLDQEVDGRSAYDVIIRLRAETEARFAVWTWGVKGINGTARSYATLQTNIRLLVAPQARLNWEKLVPDIGLDIKVHNVDLQLRDLQTTHVGAVGGWLADQIGDGSRHAVQALMDLQEKKVASKLQSRLDRLKLPEPGP